MRLLSFILRSGSVRLMGRCFFVNNFSGLCLNLSLLLCLGFIIMCFDNFFGFMGFVNLIDFRLDLLFGRFLGFNLCLSRFICLHSFCRNAFIGYRLSLRLSLFLRLNALSRDNRRRCFDLIDCFSF